MPGMTTLPAVRDTAPDLSANEFEVGYIAGDGTRHRVPVADVRAVPLEAMAPIRGDISEKLRAGGQANRRCRGAVGRDGSAGEKG